MTRFLYFCDLHYSRTPPLGRTEAFAGEVLAKLLRVKELAEEREVDAVLFGGDLFHRKGQVTHREVFDVVNVLKQFEVPVRSIWGNHDMPGEASFHFRPYGVLARTGVLDDVCEDGACIGNAFVVGCPYDGAEGIEQYVWPRLLPKHVVVLLTHGMLFLEDRTAPFDYTCVSQIRGQRARVVCCAHVHDFQGAVEREGCLYLAPGGLTRCSRPEKNRRPTVALLEIDGDHVCHEFMELPCSGDAGFLPDVADGGFSADDARSAAEALRVGSTDGESVEQCLRAAAGELGLGVEVVSEALSHVEAAKEGG